MRILLPVLLLAVVAAANPEGGDRDALKEKVQAMLDEAALLDQAGRHDEAARVREEAAALKRKIEGDRGEKDDPRVQALANLEKAIGALDKAGYEGMAKELRGMADRLRGEIKGARGQERVDQEHPDADFWRRNLETLALAMKGLSEAERHDAAEMVGRAIQARRVMLEGRRDEEAAEIMRKSPDDVQIAGLMLKAAACWREFKQPEKALQCAELGNYLQDRVAKGRIEKVTDFARGGREGPDDRLARVEERLDRMERMLHETLERLAERDRALEAQREAQRELDRKTERERGGK